MAGDHPGHVRAPHRAQLPGIHRLSDPRRPARGTRATSTRRPSARPASEQGRAGAEVEDREDLQAAHERRAEGGSVRQLEEGRGEDIRLGAVARDGAVLAPGPRQTLSGLRSRRRSCARRPGRGRWRVSGRSSGMRSCTRAGHRASLLPRRRRPGTGPAAAAQPPAASSAERRTCSSRDPAAWARAIWRKPSVTRLPVAVMTCCSVEQRPCSSGSQLPAVTEAPNAACVLSPPNRFSSWINGETSVMWS